MNNDWTIEEKISYLRKNNISIPDICKMLNVKKGTVGYYVNKLGLKGINKKIKPTKSWTKCKTEEERKKRKSQNVMNWKQEKKKLLVDYKGGKCEKCGYNKCIAALEFHHKDPSQKDFALSYNSFSFDKMKKEVDKCMLVCSNCHKEIHYQK